MGKTDTFLPLVTNMSDRFVVIDFETANPDLASICQVGVVTFEKEQVVEAWGSLINPRDYFHPWNVSIHGINEEMVKDAPMFPEIATSLINRLDKEVVVSHTAFDRVALMQVSDKYRLPVIDCVWLDSARVVRRAWSEFAWCGYGLGDVCNALEINFKHHDAIEDARAAGEILLRAMRITGLDLDGWLRRVQQPIDLSKPKESYPHKIVKLAGNPEGPLTGEEIVFTGTLSMARRQAAELASKAGCDVENTVKQTTTILVLGDQDIRRLGGQEKSSKHRKAELLVSKGQSIRFLKESDFIKLVELTG